MTDASKLFRSRNIACVSAVLVRTLSKEEARSAIFTGSFQKQLNPGLFFFSFHQCVPYLIAIGTDEEMQVRVKSDQQLSEIDSKYSVFVQVGGCRGL